MNTETVEAIDFKADLPELSSICEALFSEWYPDWHPGDERVLSPPNDLSAEAHELATRSHRAELLRVLDAL